MAGEDQSTSSAPAIVCVPITGEQLLKDAYYAVRLARELSKLFVPVP